MGHLNFRDLIKCDKNGSVRGMNLKDTTARPNCDVCTRGKMTRPPFSRRLERSTSPLQIVHTDLCGPMRTFSNGKALYFITFIDDYSRWCEIHFLKTKPWKPLRNTNPTPKGKPVPEFYLFNPTTGASISTRPSMLIWSSSESNEGSPLRALRSRTELRKGAIARP